MNDSATALLEALDEEQRAVATHFQSPVIVIAGAGPAMVIPPIIPPEPRPVFFEAHVAASARARAARPWVLSCAFGVSLVTLVIRASRESLTLSALERSAWSAR